MPNGKLEIDVNKLLKNLAGKGMHDENKESLTIGSVIMGLLISEEGASDPKRNWIIAQKLFGHDKKTKYTTDKNELEFIIKIIKKANRMMPMIKGQILDILEDIK